MHIRNFIQILKVLLFCENVGVAVLAPIIITEQILIRLIFVSRSKSLLLVLSTYFLGNTYIYQYIYHAKAFALALQNSQYHQRDVDAWYATRSRPDILRSELDNYNLKVSELEYIKYSLRYSMHVVLY